MPVYEYECQNCSTLKEITMRMVDTPPKELKCDKCKKGKMKKIISCSNFVLKGPGWAKDGYTK